MTFRRVSAALILGLAISACGASGSADGGGFTQDDAATGEACSAGTFKKCGCADGQEGTQTCVNGTFAACGPCNPIVEPPARCGDKKCQTGETCQSCEEDCGKCPLCNEAPSCNKAAIPPTVLTPMPTLNVQLEALPKAELRDRLARLLREASPEMRMVVAGLDTTAQAGESEAVKELRRIFVEHAPIAESMRRHLKRAGIGSFAGYRAQFPELAPPLYTMGGELPGPSCGAPMLRVRVAKVTVTEEDDDFANDIVYCAISAESQGGGELRVTPKTSNLDEGDSYEFSLAAGTVWGQTAPRAPSGSLLMTYNCFESDSDGGYASLLSTLGNASTQAGGVIGGQYGWVFGVVGVVGNVAAAAVGLDGDDALFNATQTLDGKDHLVMTNGASWTVRRHGTHVNSDWDWTLHMQAWGCAQYGGLNP